MNGEEHAYAKRARRGLKKFCPEIYKLFFAPLSDEELLAELNEKKALIESSRGETIRFGVQDHSEHITIIGKTRVPREEGVN